MTDKHLVLQAFQEEATECTPAWVYPPASNGLNVSRGSQIQHGSNVMELDTVRAEKLAQLVQMFTMSVSNLRFFVTRARAFIIARVAFFQVLQDLRILCNRLLFECKKVPLPICERNRHLNVPQEVPNLANVSFLDCCTDDCVQGLREHMHVSQRHEQGLVIEAIAHRFSA